MNPRIFAPAALLFAGACAETEDQAQLLVPDDIELHWSSSFNQAEDGLGALVPVDVMAYTRSEGVPLPGVEVLLEASDGAWLVPVDAVRYPEMGGSTSTVWDAYLDEYVEIIDEPAAELLLHTDASGVARVYVYADAFPELGGEPASTGGDFGAISVLVSIGDVEESFFLLPQ